jgi:DNA invertase Pin-like site-specific DNA recombinase
MEKVVLLIRVSSSKQETESQKIDLVKFVKSNGYTEEQMIILEHVESATKEIERQGLKELKEAIENENIKACFVWELSRLSRRWDILNELGNMFVRTKVNLICQKPYFRLLDNDGILDLMGGTVFDLFKNMAASEVRNRDDRMKRGKMKNASDGKSNGGNTRYGYSVNRDGKFEINRIEAEIIQTIYEKYRTGKHSVLTLMREMRDTGQVLTHSRIASILKFKGYTGKPHIEQHSGRNYFERVYPQIVSIEQYEQCAAVALKNNLCKDKRKKNNYYFASKLIKCNSCGHFLVPNKTGKHKTYLCVHKSLERLHTDCRGGISININVIDSIAWNYARYKEGKAITEMTGAKIVELEKEISELKLQNENSEKQFEGIKGKKRAALKKQLTTQNDSLIEQLVMAETESERKRIDNDILNRNAEIKYREKLIGDRKKNNVFLKYRDIFLLLNELDKFTDKQKYDIVHKHIREIQITNMDGSETPTKQIKIHYNDINNNPPDIVYYCPKVKDNDKKLYLFTQGQVGIVKRYLWNDIYIDRF